MRWVWVPAPKPLVRPFGMFDWMWDRTWWTCPKCKATSYGLPIFCGKCGLDSPRAVHEA